MDYREELIKNIHICPIYKLYNEDELAMWSRWFRVSDRPWQQKESNGKLGWYLMTAKVGKVQVLLQSQ